MTATSRPGFRLARAALAPTSGRGSSLCDGLACGAPFSSTVAPACRPALLVLVARPLSPTSLTPDHDRRVARRGATETLPESPTVSRHCQGPAAGCSASLWLLERTMASRKALLAPLGALAAVAALVLLVSNVNDGGAGAPFLGFRVLSAGHARQLTDEAEGVMADVERPQPRKSLTQIGAADVVDGRHHTKHLHQTDPVSGAQTHLVYDAIIAESAVSLDADPSLQDVVVAEDCATHERLALVARDAAAARAAAQRLAPGVLLSAGEHWGCADHATKVARKRTSASAPSPTTMTRKVIAQPVVSGNRVMLRTEHVSVAEFFERAEVTLRMSPPGDTTNNVPGQAARVVAEASRDGHTASKRRSPLQQPAPRVSKTKAVSDNFFERVWAGAGALAIDGLAMMRKIAQPPAAIPTGNVRGNNRAYAHPIDWNFDNSTQRARYPRMLRPGLTCSDCWSYMSLSAEFGLVIDNYVFKSATSSVQGNTAFNIGISAAIPKPVKAANQTTIDSIRFPPVSFYVGNVVSAAAADSPKFSPTAVNGYNLSGYHVCAYCSHTSGDSC